MSAKKHIHSIMVIFPSKSVCKSPLKNCVTKPVMTHSWAKGWRDENIFSLNNHNVTLFLNINLWLSQFNCDSSTCCKGHFSRWPNEKKKWGFHLTSYITTFPEVVTACRLFSRRSWSLVSCDICKSIMKCILERYWTWICLLLFCMWQ